MSNFLSWYEYEQKVTNAKYYFALFFAHTNGIKFDTLWQIKSRDVPDVSFSHPRMRMRILTPTSADSDADANVCSK